MAYLLGPFRRVSGAVRNLIPDRVALDGSSIHSTVEDCAAAVLEWDNGCLGTMRTNWCTAADKSGCIYQVTLYGTEGVIHINMLTHELIVYSPRRPIENARKIRYQGFEESYLVDVPEYDDHVDLLKTYSRYHETGVMENDEHLMERQANIIEAIEKLYEASETGRALEISH